MVKDGDHTEDFALVVKDGAHAQTALHCGFRPEYALLADLRNGLGRCVDPGFGQIAGHPFERGIRSWAVHDQGPSVLITSSYSGINRIESSVSTWPLPQKSIGLGSSK